LPFAFLLLSTFLLAPLCFQLLLAGAILLNALLFTPILLFARLLLAEAILLNLGLLTLFARAILLLAFTRCLFCALLLRSLIPGLPIFGLGLLFGVSLLLAPGFLFRPGLPIALLAALWVAQGRGSQKQEQNCCTGDSFCSGHGFCLHARLDAGKVPVAASCVSW
jgi:hypothetical protein